MGKVTYWVRGTVQGVGFRFQARRQLDMLRLRGAAENQPDGSVLVTAEGSEEALAALLEWLNGPNPPGWVRGVALERRTP